MKPEIKMVWVQTRAPRGDVGGCEAAWYVVEDGVLSMRDEDGKPTGQTHRLEPGEDSEGDRGSNEAAGLAERAGHV
jgi:hypothetical protein